MIGHIMEKQLGKVLMKDGKMKLSNGLEAIIYVIVVLKNSKTIHLIILPMKNNILQIQRTLFYLIIILFYYLICPNQMLL
jgi:hypothetical protein